MGHDFLGSCLDEPQSSTWNTSDISMLSAEQQFSDSLHCGPAAFQCYTSIRCVPQSSQSIRSFYNQHSKHQQTNNNRAKTVSWVLFQYRVILSQGTGKQSGKNSHLCLTAACRGGSWDNTVVSRLRGTSSCRKSPSIVSLIS